VKMEGSVWKVHVERGERNTVLGVIEM